ncbi:MAG TPA: HAMP domain-containing sensor histidine kinase [Stellaceae bacterium]|nr:HAMP domain-containing sensor histidine kinase [Stellaceae bacterium]
MAVLRASRNIPGTMPVPAGEPTAAAPGPPAAGPPTPGISATVERLARFAVIGLAIAGVLPPLAFTARPGDLGQIGAIPVVIALIGLLILAPALVGLVAALFGLDGVRDSFRVRGDKEHQQAVMRVFVGALAVGYGFAVAAAAPGDPAASACQIVASLGLAGAWLLLLLAMLDPVPSLLRQCLAMIFDAVVLSAFLHFGARLAAPWYPLYLLATFHAGFCFGPAPLAVAAVVNLIGFAAAVATTPFWHEQFLLAGGLIVALVVLPAYVGSMVREVATSRAEAAAARAARTRFLMVISQALRAPLDAIIGTAVSGSRGGDRGGDRVAPMHEPEVPAVVPAARALLSQVNNILDFSAIEAGAFVPATEAFDLHKLVNDTLADRRREAVARGLRLQIHIDPALPYRLRGWPQQLAQILDYLVARAIEVTGEGSVRIALDTVGNDDTTLHLRLTVRDEGAPIGRSEAEAMFDPFAADVRNIPTIGRQPSSTHGAFGLAVVKRLVELMGGTIEIESGVARGGSFTIVVPLAIDLPAVDSELDLGHTLVLIATTDSQFASDLAEPLNAWQGDPRWIDRLDGTLGFDRLDAGACSVLIVDGRSHTLAALSFAHRAVTGPAAPSFVLVVAEAAQIEGLVELSDGELDGVLPAPLNDQLLANALHALPLWHGAAARPIVVPARDNTVAAEPPPAEAAAPATGPQVAPIVAHPRFGADTPVVDARAVAALRGLGDGDDFLAEVIDSFRADAKEIMHRIVRAAAAADGSSFARGLHAMRSCAANLGGLRLCELLLSLREVSAPELREQGSVLVQRLGDELARLDAALADFLPEAEERASG